MSVPERHRATLHAFVDGADVQIKAEHSDMWFGWDGDMSGLSERSVLRIKPKPKVKKWLWVCNTTGTGHLFITGDHYANEGDIDLPICSVIQKIDSAMIEVDE